jgi:hypothetical protein
MNEMATKQLTARQTQHKKIKTRFLCEREKNLIATTNEWSLNGKTATKQTES